MSASSDWFEHRPRLPGPSAPRALGRRPFGATWWGAAWIEALERRAQLDPNRLPRGRTYARSGAVGALVLGPGEVLADVQGSRRSPYKVRVRVRQFDDAQWEAVLDALASQIGHTAALLDGELPAGVASDVTSVGLDLLPGPGELQARCSCPDFADPCKHAAAVCYLVADALDADPFGVLLVRGRGRDEVLAALRARRHGDTAAPSSTLVEEAADAGVLASEAFSKSPGPLPLVPAPPRRPGRPSVLAADPPPGSGVDLASLRVLAADAASRALALGHGGTSSGLELDERADLARRAASLLEGGEANAGPLSLAELARRAGVAGRELVRLALAFRDGGKEGLAMLEEAFDPAPGALDAGRDLLGPGANAWRNRLTLGERQLRLGRDGRFYPFKKDRGARWNPDGAPITVMVDDDIGSLEEKSTR